MTSNPVTGNQWIRSWIWSDLLRSSGSDPLVYFPIVHNGYPRFDDQIIFNKMIWSSNFDIGLTLGKFWKLLIWCRRTFYCINWSNDLILSKCWNQTFNFLKLNLNQMIWKVSKIKSQNELVICRLYNVQHFLLLIF